MLHFTILISVNVSQNNFAGKYFSQSPKVVAAKTTTAFMPFWDEAMADGKYSYCMEVSLKIIDGDITKSFS